MEEKFTSVEQHNLEIMYEGDKMRDSSGKIRGFLYQDLIAIDALLEMNVKYVCLEFLEDVDVIYKDGRLKIVQVKYYPKKDPVMKDISTDLYYQYLRLKLLNSKLEVKPQLVIHHKKDIVKPDYKTIKTYIGGKLKKEKLVVKDIEEKLKTEINPLKKEKQKERLFLQWAYEESVKKFLDNFEIIARKDIGEVQREVEGKMEKKFPITGMHISQENQRRILIGLAITYVQRRYKLIDSRFEKIRISKTEFEKYIEQSTQQGGEKHIVAYILAIITEKYSKIILENIQLTKEKVSMLNIIYKYTIEWIEECCKEIKGQFQLVNTLSNDPKERVEEFSSLDFSERLLKIAECRESIEIFIGYLWKIILDICMTNKSFDMEKDKKRLDPRKYIVQSKTKYICLHFPKDCVETSIIVPPSNATFKSKKKNLCLRLMKEKPKKWFMQAGEAGRYDYNYNVANIQEEESVVDGDRDYFIIECMKCIKIDEDEWNEIEECEKCIFAEECIEGKK